jgi:hypothetical protein
MKSLMVMLAEDAGRAVDEGRAKGLAAHLRRLDASLPGERFLVDAEGRDLVDGSDRTDLVQATGNAEFGLAGQPDGRHRGPQRRAGPIRGDSPAGLLRVRLPPRSLPEITRVDVP